MRRIGSTLALMLLLASPGRLSAQDSSPATQPSDLARLIGLLDSDDYATRELATRQIRLIGESARDALLAARDQGSLERRIRIDQIIQGFLARASSRPGRREPTLVSIEAQQKPLSEVCTILSAASGYPIRVAPGGDPRVTLSVRETPFFKALDSVCAQAGRRLGWDHRERALSVEATPDQPAPVAYSGPLRISLVSLTLNRQIRFGGGASASANIQIRVDAEERSQVLGVLMPIRAKEFLDDKKRSLAPPETGPLSSAQTYFQRGDQRRQIQAFMSMTAPEPDAKAIERLAFTLNVLMPTELFEAEIRNPEEGYEAGEGPFRVRVEEWKATPAQREVRIAITRPTLTAVPPANYPLQDDVVTFFSAEGRAITPTTTSASGGPIAVYSAMLPASPAVAAIRITSLKQYESAEFPVIFENIPLP